jgi:signal transduction histidine kinase
VARIAELEAELRARDDFLAIAAHELRNPMTPISARLELLLARARHMSEGAPAGLVHGLELLEGLVNAYLRRATTLLEVARASSGQLKLQTVEVDLSTLNRQVTANMLPLADRAGCQVRIAVEGGVSAPCDPMARRVSGSGQGAGHRVTVRIRVALILVVDDEFSVAEVLQSVLADAGHEVVMAGNGRQGLELLGKRRPDLVPARLHDANNGWAGHAEGH